MDGTVRFQGTAVYRDSVILGQLRRKNNGAQETPMLKSHSGPPTKGTNMPVKRKVTLEQIYAKLVSHDRHFAKHDRYFAKHDRYFAKHDRYFAKYSRHFEKHDRHLEKHDRQFDGITKLLFRIEDSIKAELAKIVNRVQKLETHVEKQTGDLERLQQEYFAVAQSLKRIEKSLADQSSKRDAELSSVFTRLDRIERHLGLAEVGPKA
jgi:chromosome segregation ATPase